MEPPASVHAHVNVHERTAPRDLTRLWVRPPLHHAPVGLLKPHAVVLILLATAVSGQAQTAVSGSLIVALRTAQSLVVAADSRLVRVDETGEARFVHDRACKVRQHDEVLFAIAGMVEGSGGFDAFALAKDVLARRQPIALTAQQYTRQLVPLLQGELAGWRAGEPEEANPGTQFLFAARENGVNVLAWTNLVAVASAGHWTVRVLQQGEWSAKDKASNVLLLGQRSAIDRATSDQIGFRGTGDAILVARELVMIAARDPLTSRRVGGQVDIAVLGPEGIFWPQRKPECK